MTSKTRSYTFFCLTAALLLTSCGYHVGGKADLMPKGIQTIAIPPFTTFTTRYALVDTLPEAISREFKSRTRYRIVDNPGEADATLTGSINAVYQVPNIYDPASGKATNVAVTVVLTLKLTERSTGRVLYSRPAYAARDNYNLPVNSHDFFDESDPAFQRLSQQLAKDVVSSILENF